MARRKYGWTEAKYKKCLSEGRGTGLGKDYKPWIYVHEIPSQGNSSKYLGKKTGRVHHLFSSHELHFAHVLDWTPEVVDFREQYPLNLAETINISNEAGIRHPIDRISRFPIPRTTDFVIDLKTSEGIRTIARAVKTSADLENDRTIELLEIERRYWSVRGIEWALVTEKEITRTLGNNLKAILPNFLLEDNLLPAGLSQEAALDALIQNILTATGTLNQLFKTFDVTHKLSPGTSKILFKHLVARKRILVDLEHRLPQILSMPAKAVLR